MHYSDPVLLRRAEPIEEIDANVRAVAARMVELMTAARGIGLAAPQVGLSWRMFVANPANEPDAARVFVNPVLVDPSTETEDYEEGCLSIPGVNAEIRRPTTVTLHATNLDGETVEATAEGLPARVWQHETDHLDGVLILERMRPVDKIANRRAIRELEAAYRDRR